MGGRLNLDGEMLNLDGETLTLDGGTRPPDNLRTVYNRLIIKLSKKLMFKSLSPNVQVQTPKSFLWYFLKYNN